MKCSCLADLVEPRLNSSFLTKLLVFMVRLKLGIVHEAGGGRGRILICHVMGLALL